MSGRDAWFRNEGWDPAIEEAFDAKLRRARDKGQPLRIQAIHLAKRHPAVALRLLDRYFALGPRFDAAAAHVARAEIHQAAGNNHAAVEAYDAALAQQAMNPGYRTSSWLQLAMLVAEAGLKPHYPRALELLDVETPKAAFRVERYKGHGARAVILHDLGRVSAARDAAALAIAAAHERFSGFHNHPSLGLVEVRTSLFDQRVAALAG